MGQYWYCVNLDRKEFISPHKLGCGLKLWEQLASHPSTGTALIILCAAMPEARGGGDLAIEVDEDELVRDLKKAAGVSYAEVAKRTIGRWTGDRIALVGDYAESDDLKPKDAADLIYDLCGNDDERLRQVAWLRERVRESQKISATNYAAELEDKANRLAKAQLYKDISDDVCLVIEHELEGKFTGDGWGHFEYDNYEVKVVKKERR